MWYVSINSKVFPFGVQVVELDLSTIVSSVSGPKRPHDRVAVSDMKEDFASCLRAKVIKSSFFVLASPHCHLGHFHSLSTV